MMDLQPRTERVDGTDYVVGTPMHRQALAARTARQDAAYLERNHALVERNLRILREMPGLEDRVRTDASYSAFLARELVFQRATVERVIYDALRAAEFVPVEGGHARGAKSYSTRIMDERGEAAVTHDLAGDAPRVDVSASEDLNKYVNVRAAYAYSVDELEAAALASVPLVRDKAVACGNAIARKLDKIGRSGDAGAGLTGFFNNAGVTLHTLTQGEWLTESVANILADLAELEQTVIAAARDNQPGGYVLVLPTAYEGRLATLPVGGSTVTDLSVKQYFLRNARIIKDIVRWVKLDDAVTPDVAASDAPMGILYPTGPGGGLKADPSVLFWPFSIQYEESPPEVRNLEWLVNARSRCGGVEVRQPKLMLYVQNLD